MLDQSITVSGSILSMIAIIIEPNFGKPCGLVNHVSACL